MMQRAITAMKIIMVAIKIEKLLTAARASGVTVIYTLFPSRSPATFPNPVISDYIPAVAPKGDEPVVTSCRQVHAWR